MKTTIRPVAPGRRDRARSATAWAASPWSRPRNGDVLALAGLAVSGPQPPGSVFKIITLAGGARRGGDRGRASRSRSRPPATLEGVALRNAGDEACGGSLTTSFAHSCNSVFAPLGARLGAKRLVRYAERFGFNEKLPIPGAQAELDPARPATTTSRSARARSARTATSRPPLTMASAGATIANGGMRRRAAPRPRRGVARTSASSSAEVAGQVRDMMLEVVRSGTGVGGRAPGRRRRGQDRAPRSSSRRPTRPSDPSNTDAWFVAFAAAPKVAVAVMLIGAGQGGASAAPVAREVLAAAL